MLKKIFIVVLILVAALLAYAAFQPDSFHVERSLSIQAPPEKIFPLVNELPSWKHWSPYEKKDPAMKRIYTGPSSGKGAGYEWSGDGNVGKGRMEITESVPFTKVLIDLRFVEPFEAHNTASFDFVPQGALTQVTWSIDGPVPYFSKLLSLFIDMDDMIGGDFEKGLKDLKAMAEQRATGIPTN
ncbi:MAG TPA: SRPBCC family protein [Burkholderiales bacterium]|nr:SRPBCC family protein [Burkholderiales bacterium]